MNLLSLVDSRLDNIYQIRRKWYYLSGSIFLQSERGLSQTGASSMSPECWPDRISETMCACLVDPGLHEIVDECEMDRVVDCPPPAVGRVSRQEQERKIRHCHSDVWFRGEPSEMVASSLEVLGNYLEPLLDDAVKDALDGVVGVSWSPPGSLICVLIGDVQP